MAGTDFLKAAASELESFNRRTKPRFSVLGDLEAAKAACRTKDGKRMIDSLMKPLHKDLQSECRACTSRIRAAWKKARGEKPTPDFDRKINELYNKSARAMSGPGIPKPRVKKFAGGSGGGISMMYAEIEWTYADLD